MKAILIGATGATGSELLNLLLADDTVTAVTALVRKPLDQAHPKLTTVVVDFDNLADWSADINGDVVFSCLGTTLKAAGSKEAQYKVDYQYQYDFARLAKVNRVPSFLLISAANAKSDSIFFYSKIKGQLEEAISALGFTSYKIFRPGPLVRPNSNRMGENIAVSIIKFLNGLGLFKSMRPLPVSELAASMLAEAKKGGVGKVVL